MCIISKKEGFIVTTDKKRIDLNRVCELINNSYWAADRSRETILKTIENSLCFSILTDKTDSGEKQVAFGRIITDYATYAYICDIFIDENYRGKGLGKWMVECMLACDTMSSVKKWALTTRDAHELYRKYGFAELKHPENAMMLVRE